MTRQPLILSALPHDIHAHAVRWGLGQSGMDALWVQSVADHDLPPLSLSCDSEQPWRAAGWLDSDATGTVWYRRPRNPREFPGAQPNDVNFIANEWARVLNNVHALSGELTDSLWVNPPPAAINAENKLVQLRAARRCGLRFPPTLVSHDPEEIRRFAARHGKIIYKCFMPHAWKAPADDKTFSVYATVLEPEMLEDDASLALCPGIFQAYVEKQCDLRVVIIGEHFFTLRMGSGDGRAFVDWRAYQNMPELVTEPCELPTGYRDKLKRLMRELGLVFGCVDIVLDDDGQPHFLEINQAGQFLFVENYAPSLPLLRAMCALLAQGRADCDLNAIADISYQTYIDSEEHQVWWAGVAPELEAERDRPSSWISIE